MDANDILQAQQWLQSLEKVAAVVVRDENELAKYETQDNANKTAISIRRERIQILKEFIGHTQNIIELQRDKLEEFATLHSKHKLLYKDHQILRKYMASLGYDLDLLKYMFLKDN